MAETGRAQRARLGPGPLARLDRRPALPAHAGDARGRLAPSARVAEPDLGEEPHLLALAADKLHDPIPASIPPPARRDRGGEPERAEQPGDQARRVVGRAGQLDLQVRLAHALHARRGHLGAGETGHELSARPGRQLEQPGQRLSRPPLRPDRRAEIGQQPVKLGRVAAHLDLGRATGRPLAQARRSPIAKGAQVGGDRLAVGRIGRVEPDPLAVPGQLPISADVAEQSEERRRRHRPDLERRLEREADEWRDRDLLPRRERSDRLPALLGQDEVVVGRDERASGAGRDPDDGPRPSADRADVRADRPQPRPVPAERPGGGANLLDRQRVPVGGRDRCPTGDAADVVADDDLSHVLALLG